MIDAREALDAIHATAEATIGLPIGLHATPDAPVCAVIEQPPGSGRPGTLGCPGADLTLRVRVRGVARHRQVDQAARAASDAAHRVAAALTRRGAIAPPAGANWTVDHATVIADGGILLQGDLANAVLDIDVHLIAA